MMMVKSLNPNKQRPPLFSLLTFASEDLSMIQIRWSIGVLRK